MQELTRINCCKFSCFTNTKLHNGRINGLVLCHVVFTNGNWNQTWKIFSTRLFSTKLDSLGLSIVLCIAAAAAFVTLPLSKVAAIGGQPPDRALALVPTRERLLAPSRPFLLSQIDPRLHTSADRSVTCLGAWLAYLVIVPNSNRSKMQ